MKKSELEKLIKLSSSEDNETALLALSILLDHYGDVDERNKAIVDFAILHHPISVKNNRNELNRSIEQ